MAMTAYQLAQDECANLVDNRCVSDGKPCKLADGKLRCAYFEACIVPLRTHTAHPNHIRYLEAIDQYIDTRNVPGRTVTVRKCECGKALGPRQRRCSDCGKALAKERSRERVRAHRLKTVGM